MYNMINNSPTKQTYSELQHAYDYWNSHLFNNSLPSCLITLQREKKTQGYFCYNRFINDSGDYTDEIALNPSYFASHGLRETMQTLVHEMCHLWQYHQGTPGRRGYHNKEWADKMESIGLMPSSTGLPGGSRTGDRMADYVISNGRFDKLYEALIGEHFNVSWMDRVIECVNYQGVSVGVSSDTPGVRLEAIENPIETQVSNRSNRVKYCCYSCNVNLWGKPNLNIICGECGNKFEVELL